MNTYMKIAAQFSELAELFEELADDTPAPAEAPKKKAAKKKAAPKEEPAPEPVGNMPPPPDMSNPVQIPDNLPPNLGASNPVPFNDQNGLVAYIGAAFQEMGREKGQKIADVLKSMGHTQISDLKPEEYQTFYNSVETLKNA